MASNDEIGLAIPSMRPMGIRKLLGDIQKQTHRVKKIIVVDNYETGLGNLKQEFPALPLEIIDFGRNVGPCYVWNMMMRMPFKFVGTFNDDVRIQKDLFSKCIHIFNSHPNVGVISPKHLSTWPLPREKKNGFAVRRIHGKGKAGGFLMRGKMANKMPLIDERFFMYFNDSWIGRWTLGMGYIWTMCVDSFLYHDPHHSAKHRDSEYIKWCRQVVTEERKIWDADYKWHPEKFGYWDEKKAANSRQ